MTARDDYDSLRQGCGLACRPAGLLVLSGADRERFLNGKVTCEVAGLVAGQGTYGFFTNPQGKILADVAILVEADRILLELAAEHLDAIAGHLRKYLLTDRVEILAPAEAPVAWTLLGPRATAAVERWLAATGGGELPAAAWAHRRLALAAAGEVVVVRQGQLGVEAWTLWAAAGVDLGERLGALPGVRPVGPAALDTVRTEAGLPRFGRDYGPENFPQETGVLALAVSYTKRCYLGQEVVARIHYRGGVRKGLAGLVFAGEVAAGANLLHEDKEVGKVTTVTDSPALGRRIGLAVVQLGAAQPGTLLAVAGGGQAEVHPLPFVPAA